MKEVMMSKEIDISDADFEGQTSKGVTLVDFWAPWCGPCRMQGPIIEKVAARVNGNAKVGKCNVDENPAVAARLGIRSIPTLSIFTDGEEAERLVGLQEEDTLVERLDELVGAA
jgi:thioredoxin 1